MTKLQNLEYQLLRAARFMPNSAAGVLADKFLNEDDIVTAIRRRIAFTRGYGFWFSAEPLVLTGFLENAGLPIKED